MGKGTRGKSSASAATRKKQAAKAAAKHGGGDAPPPTQKSGKKLSKKERQALKTKSYVPPPKPPQPPPFPLDSMGLASLLPADLVVLLRKALKKDIVTRVRTLESLLAWIQGKPVDEQEVLSDEERSSALLIMIPCWVHLFPRLALSPSQRLRYLTLQVHKELLQLPDVREELTGAHNIEPILGFWAVLAHDTTRSVARLALQLWKDSVSWEGSEQPPRVPLNEYTTTLLDHLRPILLTESASVALAHSTASLQLSTSNEPHLDAKSRDETNVDESADELDARLVAGGLGALITLIQTAPELDETELESFAESPTLWTSLQTRTSMEESTMLGNDAPLVRQRAWALLALLNARMPKLVDEHLDTIMAHAFSGAWAERNVAVLTDMLAALLPLLRRRPDAWEEDEDEEDEDPFSDFLTWAQLAGVQAPRVCFPAVLVFLSTVPPSVLPPTTEAAAEVLRPLVALAHVLVQSTGSIDPLGWDAYASMVCECIAFLVMRILRTGDDEEKQSAVALTTELLSVVWDEMVIGRATDVPRIPARFCKKTAREWGRCLVKLDTEVDGQSVLDGTLAHARRDLDAEFDHADEEATRTSLDAAEAMGNALTAALDAANARNPPLPTLAERIVALGSRLILLLCAGAACSMAALPVLSNVLSSPLGQGAHEAKDALHKVATTHAAQAAAPADAAAFYEAYMTLGQGTSDVHDIWTAVLEQSMPPHFSSLPLLLRIGQHTPLPDVAMLAPWQASLKAYLAENEPPRDVAAGLLGAPPALLGDAEDAVLAAAATHVQRSADDAWAAALGQWHAYAPEERTARFCSEPALQRALPAVYAAGYLHNVAQARDLWNAVASAASQPLDAYAVSALRAAILKGDVPASAVFAAARTLPGDGVPILQVLPDKSQLDAALLLALDTPMAEYHILDPLIPVNPLHGNPDWFGLASVLHAYLAALEHERGLAEHIAYALPHLIYAAITIEDALQGSSSLAAYVLSENPDQDEVEDRCEGGCYPEGHDWEGPARQQLVRIAHTLTRLLASTASELPETWHVDAAKAVAADAPFDTLTTIVCDVWKQGKDAPHIFSRILARLFSGIFSLSSASPTEVEPWIRLVSAKATPDAYRGALLLATRFAADTKAHDRVRNELGASLGGTPPSRANTEGVSLLTLLRCAAPPPELGLPLIPMQRAVHAMQAVQNWLKSEEDIDDEVFALLPPVCAELAPVLQGVAGRPIEMMFDLVEENLAAADISATVAGWPAIHTTLSLYEVLLSLESEHVAAALASHKEAIDKALHDLFLQIGKMLSHPDPTADLSTESIIVNAPVRCAVYEKLARLASDLPPKIFAQDQAALAYMIQSTTTALPLQFAAFRLYTVQTRETVREQVIELAVAPDQAPQPLDASFVHSLTRYAPITSAVWDESKSYYGLFSFFLQWLAIFEHFTEASLALKSVYAAALEQHSLTGSLLLPSIFAVLGGAPRNERAIKPLDMTRYAIDDVLLEELSPTNPISAQVLAAHVYYRALIHLPTQVRDWFLSVRDRQLSLQVSHLTTKFCTPLLAERELSHLRDPTALSRLQDEAMAIKILSSNEVVATYTVDEHPMEIGVRLPSDFPLHGVEIRDIKRVGVSEAQWRAWLLAVQQMLSGKNGLILDALMLFKKSAEAKFQGYEGAECAICYSIISPTDQTLPNKPCRTCKHRFHGSCLYKWVSTSGASTCPLCRSIL